MADAISQRKISKTEEANSSSKNAEFKISHSLYLYDKERFNLVTTTLTAEQESQLQSFLLRRIKKGAVYSGTGSFSTMDFSIAESSSTPAVCFYVLLPCGKHSDGSERQIVICFLATSEVNLEVFRLELSRYCDSLAAEMSSSKDISTCASRKLTKWYCVCVEYVCRVLQSLGGNVSCILQLAEQNRKICTDGVDKQLAEDVRQFLTACSVNECLSSQECNLPPATLRSDRVDGVDTNTYCKEWGQLLLEHGYNTEPWRIRRAMEAFKLKTIKDMNMLKRLLKQSETDHYSLYRAYSFLWQSGNSDVLLEHAKTEGSSSPDVIAVLEEHMAQQHAIITV